MNCIRKIRVICLAVGVVASLFSTVVNAQITWRAAQSTPKAQTRQQVLDALYEVAMGERDTHVVVRFEQPLSADHRASLAGAGVTLQSYLGDNAYFASIAARGLDMATVEALDTLREVRSIAREWKLHPVLAGGDEPSWAMFDRKSALPDQSGKWLIAYVLFHKDTPADQARSAVESVGGIVKGAFAAANGMVIEMPLSAVDALTERDEVMYLEPAQPALTPTNAENRGLTGANTMQATPYDLSGNGVAVMVYDGGVVRSTHLDFDSRVVILDDDPIGIHATHVAGTIGGSGVASGGFDRGMAPGVDILSYSFDYTDPPQGMTLVTDPLDLEADIADALTHGADIMNASLSANIAGNGLDCAFEGDYTVVSTLIDSITRGAVYGKPFLSVWGGGNERSAGACGTGFGTIPPPHAGKNHIVVGAVNANNDSMTDFSSWGPVDDGRIKPDFVAPGCQVGGDNGVTSVSGFDDTGYVTICGTSMAAPTVTGLAALLIEDYRAQYPDRPLFRSATLKAWLAHTAIDRGTVGPDFKFGYGSVRIQPAVDLMRSGAFWEGVVEQGDSYSRVVTVAPGDPELKVTLVWDDFPAVPNVVTSLVNDLDLVVTSPTAVRHYPWTLDPENPNSPALRNQVDRLNNIEQVRVDNPEAGEWTIEVLAHNVPEGPQPFTLVGDGASQSGLTIDLPAGPLMSLPPEALQPLDVHIVAAGETVVPGSPLLHYRYDGGVFLNTPLIASTNGLYTGTFPEAACGDLLDYYVSVEGTASGTITYPGGGPANYLTAHVGTMVDVLVDNFESDLGWTTSVAGATDGQWERGVPVPRTALAFGPEFDADSSGQCYVTDNAAGLSDVDNGGVILTSPALDLAGPAAEISFMYYLYTNSYMSGDDRLTAEVSTNGTDGPWVELFRYRYPTSAPSDTVWHLAKVSSEMMNAAGLTPSSDTRIRFIAHDGGTSSTVEAGIDAVTVRAFRCVAPTCSDTIKNQGEDRIDCGGPCAACACVADATCDNSLFCDGAESCDAFGNCQSESPPCSVSEWCSESASSCVMYGEGDFDFDGDVDLSDFRSFQVCMSLNAEYEPNCAAGNLIGGDGWIDLTDLAEFLSRITGPAAE